MNAENTKAAKVVRYGSVDELAPAPPLSKAVKTMSDAGVKRRAAADPDACVIRADFWATAQVVEPEGTEQITLRLPRRVLGHFKSKGKGYQTRISAVLSSSMWMLRKRARRAKARLLSASGSHIHFYESRGAHHGPVRLTTRRRTSALRAR
jgi:uncharacterized protein (DUF4415 family)